MAKSNAALKAVEPSVNVELLTKIAQESVKFVSKSEAESVGINHNPPLIEVNLDHADPNDSFKVLCRILPAGAKYLMAHMNSNKETTEVNTGSFEIISDAVLPPVKRGGGGAGAPQKYPFDSLEIGQSFFVPATAKAPNPLKTMGSTISQANLRYATQTGTKTVERSKRGAKNKLVLDDDGHKIMEEKEVPVYEFTRKFTIRGVKGGTAYGNWTAPSDGALVMRKQ